MGLDGVCKLLASLCHVMVGIWLHLCYFRTHHVGLDIDVKPKPDEWASEWLVNKRESTYTGLDFVCNCLALLFHVLFGIWWNSCYFCTQHVGLDRDAKPKPDEWASDWLVNKRESPYTGLGGVCNCLASLCHVMVSIWLHLCYFRTQHVG
jgi:succinate dehydrogenase/fumarate reductase cytochrome b subunit